MIVIRTTTRTVETPNKIRPKRLRIGCWAKMILAACHVTEKIHFILLPIIKL